MMTTGEYLSKMSKFMVRRLVETIRWMRGEGRLWREIDEDLDLPVSPDGRGFAYRLMSKF